MLNNRAVTICSSSKYYDLALRVAQDFTDAGLQVHTPRFDFNETQVDVLRSEKHDLTVEFLEKIRKSSCLYVIASQGYTGRSVCIEVGFATGLGLPVVISEPPQEPAIEALVDAVVSTDDATEYVTEILDGKRSFGGKP
jgi:hypothetical protein